MIEDKDYALVQPPKTMAEFYKQELDRIMLHKDNCVAAMQRNYLNRLEELKWRYRIIALFAAIFGYFIGTL